MDGKVCIVTGAAGGIGRAAAELLLEAGATVVLVDLAAQPLAEARETLAALHGPDRLAALVLDVSDEGAMALMAGETLGRFGGIDALVASAGILRLRRAASTVAETPADEWRRILAVNLTGTFLSNRAVLPAMLARGAGDILNISSTSGLTGRAFDAPYCASKFGILGFTDALADEVGRQGVRVQCLLPDAVDTGLWEQNVLPGLKPPAALAPRRVAELIHRLLTLPSGAHLRNPTLHPFASPSRGMRSAAR